MKPKCSWVEYLLELVSTHVQDVGWQKKELLCMRIHSQANIHTPLYCEEVWYVFYVLDASNQGYNARKVISEVYASFVRQCKHKTEVLM